MLPSKSTRGEVGLLTNFKKSATKLLEDAERYVNNPADESIKLAFTLTLENYKVQATQLQKLFEKVVREEGDSRLDRYMKAARTIGKGGRVESLIRGTLDDLQLLATKFPEVTTRRGKEQLAKAIEGVPKMQPSLADGSDNVYIRTLWLWHPIQQYRRWNSVHRVRPTFHWYKSHRYGRGDFSSIHHPDDLFARAIYFRTKEMAAHPYPTPVPP
jgi:hypothetical protein